MAVNLQTYWLAGSKRHHYDRSHNWERYSPEQLLDQAKQNLETIALGIVGHLAESVQLMTDFFDWNQTTLSEKEHEETHRCVVLDVEIYEYAVNLFRQRYPGVSTVANAVDLKIAGEFPANLS